MRIVSLSDFLPEFFRPKKFPLLRFSIRTKLASSSSTEDIKKRNNNLSSHEVKHRRRRSGTEAMTSNRRHSMFELAASSTGPDMDLVEKMERFLKEGDDDDDTSDQ